MATLNSELRQAVEQAGDTPLRIEDTETHSAYVILKAEVYERMKTLLEEEEIDPSFYEFEGFEPSQ